MPSLRFIPLLLALLGAAAAAQTPDSTNWRRYLPLAVGNEWHYDGWVRAAGGTLTETSERRDRVVAFDPAPPGVYIVERFLRTNPTGGPPTEVSWTERWRYDPATRRVEAEGAPRTPCPLDADFGSWVLCAWGSSTHPQEVSGGYAEGVAVGTDTVTTSRKRYRASHDGAPGVMVRIVTEYGAGIGEMRVAQTSHGWTPAGTALRELRYARIDGEEYGQPLFPVAAEAPPSPAPLAAAVYPNPATDRAVVSFTLGAPAEVRLALYDVLGREVAAVEAGRLDGGVHRVGLDLSALPAGVYVWRLHAGGAVETQRLTVAR